MLAKQQYLHFDEQEQEVFALKGDALPDAAQPDADFDSKVRLAIESVIQQFEEGRHCCVGTSYGKDSSVTNALVCRAMLEAVDRGIDIPHVVFAHSMTTYDNPEMDTYALGEMDALRSYIAKHNLPASVEVQQPTLSNDYLVNVIGGRMVATMPGTGRACADMLKVQTNKQLKRRIRDRLPGEVLNVVGKRWDESDFRAGNMSESGERPDKPVTVNGELLLTPIAHFTLDDIWQMVGMVKMSRESDMAAAYETYSDFEAMTKVYRDAMGGECMINAFGFGKAGSSGCGQRFGCWTCTQVENDRSMENMVADTHPHFKPMLLIRQMLVDNHWDPSKRRWLTREPNASGELSIEANAYSPDFCRELLRCVITAQVDEQERAMAEGTVPAFELFTERKLLAVQALWSRYGMHEPWAALSDWHAIHDGARYYPESVESPAARADFANVRSKGALPLTVYTGDDAAQLTNVAGAISGANGPGASDSSVEVDVLQPLNSQNFFDVDEEGAELFVWILGPDILEKAREADFITAMKQERPDLYDTMKEKAPMMLRDIRLRAGETGRSVGTRPSDVIRTMLNIGCLSIREGDRGTWEKMLTVADSLAWYQVSDIMDDPDALNNAAKIVTRYGGGLEPPHINAERADAMKAAICNIIATSSDPSSAPQREVQQGMSI